MPEKPPELTPDALQVREVMKPGRAYEPSQISRKLGLSTASVLTLMERLAIAGELECGMFRNTRGGSRTCFYRPDEHGGLRGIDSARRVIEVRAKDVFGTMKPGEGYRAVDLAKRHDISIHRMTALLSVLVREGQVAKKTIGDEHRRRGLYYVAGTEPGAVPSTHTSTPATVPLAERPAYDNEYARSLRSLRDLSQAGRGRS
ncbi:hypothetical protein [Burkholderia seminalis]|uniref:hypothetical protein n=1 Tax=Burkholderia seminalis TaxID=488731 RepID=UPI001ABB0D49|nr:hypothetical protein [Burkholderia seminalis]